MSLMSKDSHVQQFCFLDQIYIKPIAKILLEHVEIVNICSVGLSNNKSETCAEFKYSPTLNQIKS